MRRLILALPLLAGCDPYSRSYSLAVQNQMLDADDRRGAQISELQRQVQALQRQQADEAVARARGDDDIMVVVRAQGNAIEANSNVEKADFNLEEARASAR